MNIFEGKHNKKETLEEEFDDLCDPSKYKRLAKIFLVVLFGGFLMWAALIPLEEGVPTSGKVVVDTKRKEIQHSVGGVISEFYVREGDFVKKDQLLIKLGDSRAKSEVMIEENNINSLNENIKSRRTSIEKIQDVIKGKELQISLVLEELNGIRGLVSEGYAPKVRQLALEKELNGLETSKKEVKTSYKQTLQTIDELKFKLRAAEERLVIAKRALDKKEIRASVSGQVVDIQKQAVGAVIRPAEKIMDLVPKNELLLIEAEIKPNLIDRVSIDDVVDIRFTSFSLTPFLVVSGKIKSISSDVLFKEKSNEPYYLARVSVTDEGMVKLGKRKMRPGMEVGVIFKTGSRTLLTYLLHPLTRRIAYSLKEE